MQVAVTSRAKRDLKKLPRQIKPRVTKAIEELAADPYPHGSIKLTNQPGYRIREGDYRVLYIVKKEEQKVYITRVRHRRESYR